MDQFWLYIQFCLNAAQSGLVTYGTKCCNSFILGLQRPPVSFVLMAKFLSDTIAEIALKWELPVTDVAMSTSIWRN